MSSPKDLNMLLDEMDAQVLRLEKSVGMKFLNERKNRQDMELKLSDTTQKNSRLENHVEESLGRLRTLIGTLDQYVAKSDHGDA